MVEFLSLSEHKSDMDREYIDIRLDFLAESLYLCQAGRILLGGYNYLVAVYLLIALVDILDILVCEGVVVAEGNRDYTVAERRQVCDNLLFGRCNACEQDNLLIRYLLQA